MKENNADIILNKYESSSKYLNRENKIKDNFANY